MSIPDFEIQVRLLKNKVSEASPKSARIMDSQTDKELRTVRNSARYAIELLYERFTAGYTVDDAEVTKHSELLHQVEWELGVHRRIVPTTTEQKKSREAKKQVCAIREGINRRQQLVSHSSPADSPHVERSSSSSRGHGQYQVNRSTDRHAHGQGPSSRIQAPASRQTVFGSRQAYSIPRIQPTQHQQPRRDIGRYTLSAMQPARQGSRRGESPANIPSEHRRPKDVRSSLASNRRSGKIFL